MLEMIFDRSESDLTESKNLVNKVKIYGIDSLTQQQQTNFFAGLKGCYNISDLNRVENAVSTISSRLINNSYPNSVSTKTWQSNEFFTVSQVLRYLTNINILRQAFYVKPTTPSTPNSYKPYQKANDIEKILYDIDILIDNMIAEFRPCGTFNCNGMEGLI